MLYTNLICELHFRWNKRCLYWFFGCSFLKALHCICLCPILQDIFQIDWEKMCLFLSTLSFKIQKPVDIVWNRTSIDPSIVCECLTGKKEFRFKGAYMTKLYLWTWCLKFTLHFLCRNVIYCDIFPVLSIIHFLM